MELAHARRLVRQKRAEWEGPKVRILSAQEYVERIQVKPTVASLRAAGIPAVEVRHPKRRCILWPARLTIIERARLANGKLPEDPTEFRSFARYPDAWSIATMKREAQRTA